MIDKDVLRGQIEKLLVREGISVRKLSNMMGFDDNGQVLRRFLLDRSNTQLKNLSIIYHYVRKQMRK